MEGLMTTEHTRTTAMLIRSERGVRTCNLCKNGQKVKEEEEEENT